MPRKLPSWIPFQDKGTRGQDTTGVPPVYIRCNGIDQYDPYKQKAIKFGVFVAISITVGELPAWFSVNPYTHQPDPAWSALGIFFAVATLLLGAFYLKIEQFFHSEEAHKFALFGAFTLRVRKWYKCKFVSPIGTIERIPDDLAASLRAILDEKVTEYKNQATALKDLKDKIRDPTKLNPYYFPLPENELPDCLLLSTAPEPSYLHNGSPAEIIWKKNIRRVPKLEDFDFADLYDYRFEIPGIEEVQVVPICVAAGTFFDFTAAIERALLPPVIDNQVVASAVEAIDAKLVGYEATQLVTLLRRTVNVNRKIDDKRDEAEADMAGKILELEEAIAKKKDRQPEKAGPSKVKTAFAIAAISIFALIGAGLAYEWFFKP